MFGIGTSELILLGIIAVIMIGGRLPSIVSSLRESMKAFRSGMEAHQPQRSKIDPARIGFIELVTKQRDTTMTERWKKFLWSPAFWATLGVFGCATGLYFQRVAGNGSGLWCLGLVFLGAAYIEKNP